MKKSFPPDTPYDNHDDLLTLLELKANADSAQDLGAQIVALSDKHLKRIPLDGALLAAIMEARRLTGPEAKRRQLQFVGRLMRSADIDGLRAALEQVRLYPRPPTAAEQQAQEWVTRLLAEGQAAIEALLLAAPQAERQRLSQLTRQIHKDQKQNKPSRARRELTTYLEELLA